MAERKSVPASRPAGHETLYSRDLVAVLSAGGAFGFASSVFYLLPKFLTELGAGPSEIGAATAAYGAATVAVTPLIGLWIDAVSRVLWLRLGAGLTLLSALGFLAVHDCGATLFVLRAVQGAAFAAFFTGLTALVTDLAPPSRFSEALGLAGASMLVMNAVAPAVVEPLAARFGWEWGFVAAAAAGALSLAIACGLPRVAPTNRGADMRGLVTLVLHRRTRHYAIVTAAVGAAFGVMFTYPQPYALMLGMSSVRGFFIAYCSAALGARLVLGRMSDRLGRFPVAVCALNLYTLVVLATAELRPGMLEPLGALMGLAHGLFFPAFNAIAIEATEIEARGKMVTVFTGAFYGGAAVVTLPLGALAEVAGFPWVFTVSAALTFAAGGLLVFSPELSPASARASSPLREPSAHGVGISGPVNHGQKGDAILAPRPSEAIAKC